MKKLVFAVAMAVATVAAADVKFGTVDLMLLVRNHPNYESNKALLSTTDKDYQKKLEAIKSEGDKMQEEGKKLAEQMRNPLLTAKAKGDIEKQLSELQQKLFGVEQRYRSEALRCRQDLQDLESRLLKTTTDDLRKRIEKFAEKEGYDYIVDVNVTAYAKKSLDVTGELLKALGVDPAAAKNGNEGK